MKPNPCSNNYAALGAAFDSINSRAKKFVQWAASRRFKGAIIYLISQHNKQLRAPAAARNSDLVRKCLAQSMFMAQYFPPSILLCSRLLCLCSQSVFVSTRLDLCWSRKFCRRDESGRYESSLCIATLFESSSSADLRFPFYFPLFAFSLPAVTFYSFRLRSHPPANCFGSSRNSLVRSIPSFNQLSDFLLFRNILIMKIARGRWIRTLTRLGEWTLIFNANFCSRFTKVRKTRKSFCCFESEILLRQWKPRRNTLFDKQNWKLTLSSFEIPTKIDSNIKILICKCVGNFSS